MGDIIGGLIGGVGSLLGGSSAKSNALTGYNYLNKANAPAVANGQAASNAEAQLTGTAPVQQGTTNAFNNYLNSTGYNFAKQQGSDAVTGSQSAKGILNSGSTAKALTNFGTGLASQGFNNYLGQLNTQTNQGLTASGQVGQAGTQGGATAANGMQSGISKAGGMLGSIATSLIGL